MTVEIKQSDSPEEIEKKMKVLYDARENREAERIERIKSFSGILKRDDIDPIEIQKKMRDEWN